MLLLTLVCCILHSLNGCPAGYVRRTTSRFCPDDPDKHMTINRPLTWNGKFAACFTPINIDKTLGQKGGSSNGSGSSSSNSSEAGRSMR